MVFSELPVTWYMFEGFGKFDERSDDEMFGSGGTRGLMTRCLGQGVPEV